MAQKFPEFKTDAEAESFVANADLTEYDLSDVTPVRFELRKKDHAVTLRLPEALYEAVKQRAVSADTSAPDDAIPPNPPNEAR